MHGGGAVDVDEVAWTDRLLLIMRSLDDSAVGGLLNFSGIKAVYVLFSSPISLCVRESRGLSDIEACGQPADGV